MVARRAPRPWRSRRIPVAGLGRGPPSWPGDPPAPRHQDPRRPPARATAASAAARPRCAPRRSRRWPRPAATTSAPPTARPGCSSWSARCATGWPSCSPCPTATRCCSATAAPPRSGTPPSFGLIDRRSQHLRFGEFSSKFAEVTAAAPHLDEPANLFADPGTHPLPVADPDVDAYCLTHNETSTGVAMPLERPAGADGPRARRRHLGRRRPALRPERGRRLLLRPAEVPRLRRRPVAGRGVARRHRAHRAHRGVRPLGAGVARPRHRAREQPQGPDLQHARRWPRSSSPTSRSSGSTSTAASSGRRRAATGRPTTIYGWAEASTYATPFVAEPDAAQPRRRHHRPRRRGRRRQHRLRRCSASNGIVDTESYRKLGRNQLRIALFPAIEPDDVAALTRCIDHVVEALAA